MSNNTFILWGITEPSPQAAVTAALAAMQRRRLTMTRLVFPVGATPQIKVPAGVSVEEAGGIPPKHFQIHYN